MNGNGADRELLSHMSISASIQKTQEGNVCVQSVALNVHEIERNKRASKITVGVPHEMAAAIAAGDSGTHFGLLLWIPRDAGNDRERPSMNLEKDLAAWRAPIKTDAECREWLTTQHELLGGFTSLDLFAAGRAYDLHEFLIDALTGQPT